MQPQDNDFPLDQVQGSSTPPQDAGQAQQNPLSGGAVFQPQAGGASATAPSWQNDMQNDATQLYSQPEEGANPQLAPQPTQPSQPSAQPMETSQATPQNPLEAMNNDMQNATNLAAAPAASPAEPSAMPTMEAQPAPIDQASQQNPLAQAGEIQPENPTGPQLSPQEPIQPAEQMPAQPPAQPMPSSDPYAQQPAGLPGADSLGAAVVGMEQPSGVGMQQPMQPQVPAGSYGPPPQKGGKKVLFIVIGIIIGLLAIGGGVFFFLRSRTTQSTETTPTPTPAPEPTSPVTPVPSSGPATPPEGYATIEKQCYSFALIVPNTVPQDQSCSFADATFGKKQISTISVETFTEEFKALEDALAIFRPTVTVESEKDIKLDNLDGKQVIYKNTDGRTYSKVFVLIVGKNYQQEGKNVTSLALTTAYQEAFDTEVTTNVIDTWRWK